MPEREVVWCFAESVDSELWDGPCTTREEAIAAARREYTYKGVVPEVWVRTGYKPTAMDFMPNADAILEIVQEAADDEAGEVAEDFTGVSTLAGIELDELLKAWATKWLTVNFFVCDGVPECVAPEAPDAA